MSEDIDLKYVEQFKTSLVNNLANNLKSSLQDWSALHENGRIKLGWKRIAYGNPIRIYQLKIINFEPLSTFKIIKRKIDRWGIK